MCKMKMVGVVIIFLLYMLSACNSYWTKDIGETLHPSKLYHKFQLRIIDYSVVSKCTNPLTVKLVNMATLRNPHHIGSRVSGIFRHYVNPKKMTQLLIDYLRHAFARCKVQASDTSNKVLQLSFIHLQLLGRYMGANGAELTVRLKIPEIKYTKIYKRKDWTADWAYVAMAYTVHRVVFDIVNDPVIQKYIQCR